MVELFKSSRGNSSSSKDLNMVSSSSSKGLLGSTSRHDGETFSYLGPSSNLDRFPRTDQPPYFHLTFRPTMLEVIQIRRFLHSMLPNEVIDVILDLAEYWPRTTSILDLTTRVYSGHMSYGSYQPPKPRKRWGRKTPIEENRREFNEHGFVLRTPPLGWRCAQTEDLNEPARKSMFMRRKIGAESDSSDVGDWLPPRGSHPARMIVFEILSRQERQGWPFSQTGTFAKTSLDACIDHVISHQPPKQKSPLPSQAHRISWPTKAATMPCYIPDPKTKAMGFSLQAKRSASAHPTLTPGFPVLWNRWQYSKKSLDICRWDDDSVTFYGSDGKPLVLGITIGEWVRSLEIGDCISLWARAESWMDPRGPCCNIVDRVKIHVFWAV